MSAQTPAVFARGAAGSPLAWRVRGPKSARTTAPVSQVPTPGTAR
ncbi:hypothetical protein [Amycolatopsis sp. NPDC051128]